MSEGYENYLRFLVPSLIRWILIFNFNHVGNDIIEVIIAYKDNSDHVDLDTCAEVANAFAEAIVRIALDVSSEGAERGSDLEEIESVLNEYVFVKFKIIKLVMISGR